ncbi:MAG: copper resistance protein NlpE N-terminal domain-containing protein [Breznakibacter sp.]
MRTNALPIALLFMAGMFSCHTVKQPASHNSKNSLDWNGAYYGIVPCADCEGIGTLVVLNSDLTYRVETEYIGKSGDTYKKQGTFSWDESGNMAILDNTDKDNTPSYYAVGENTLTQLDLGGQKITGNLADKYVLRKEPLLVEKYWKLIEINGEGIPAPEKWVREPHIIFKANNRVIGHSSCNSFAGSYNVQNGNLIRISNVASTRMACPSMDVENKMLVTLEAVGSYHVHADTLQLNDGKGNALTKFVAVYLY